MKSSVGGSGLYNHVEKLRDAINCGRVPLDVFAEEMRLMFNQRVQLGLVRCHSHAGRIAGEIKSIDVGRPEFLIVLADHDPAKGALKQELITIQSLGELPFDVKIASANFLGYGLYDECIFGIDEFIERFGSRVLKA